MPWWLRELRRGLIKIIFSWKLRVYYKGNINAFRGGGEASESLYEPIPEGNMVLRA